MALIGSAFALADSGTTNSGITTHITADRGEYDSRQNIHRLWGNVRIQHGSLVVLADEGSAHRGQNDDERIELLGQPARWSLTLEDGSEAQGEAAQIVYHLSNNLITMVGDAKVRDGRGTFTGAQLSYSLDTETMIGEGGVEVLIEPPQD